MNNPLLARFADTPALIDPRAGSRFEADLSAILQHPRAHELMASAEFTAGDGFWFAPDDWRSMYRPYVVVDGILQIPVKGVLLYDFPWALGSWATGYAYIGRAIERGLADGNVRGIALIVYSYGGQGDGCFDLANKIYAGSSVKPIKAFAQMAYSAGYAVASAAGAITASSNAGIGSIGVVMTHLDVSRAMEDAGMKITFVHFGKHKVDGNAYQPLPDEVKARWQAWCDEQGEQFCSLVARNRGLDIAAVRATEAECYHASEAMKLGLIDAIAPLDDAVTAFSPELSNADDDEEGDTEMSGSVPAAGPAATMTLSWELGLNPGVSFYPERGHPVSDKLSHLIPEGKVCVGVSINNRPDLWKAIGENRDAIRALFANYEDAKIVPIVSTIHINDGDERDDIGFNRFVEMFDLKDRVIARETADPAFWREHIGPADVKYLVSRCRLLVSARKHNIIHAIGSGVPFVALFEAENDSITRVYQTLLPELPAGSFLYPLFSM